MTPRPSVTAITRRTALKRGLAGILAAGAAPLFLPARLFGARAPSNRIHLGLIGNGLMCRGHATALAQRDDCRIVALCDVWRSKAERTREAIAEEYAAAGAAGGADQLPIYGRHEELLARDDVDAVFICTPDHWHAAIARDALQSGRDVYCEKPLTLTVAEGRLLVETARRYGRVFQTGSQQRSNASFRKAAEMVRNGWIGDITRIRTRLGHFPPAASLGDQGPVPADLDYDRWLGPTPWRPYHPERVRGDYGGGWRCFFEYSGRKNADWGAHHFDIIQWALGMDASGPVEFIPAGWEGNPYQTHVYASGVRVERVDENGPRHMIEFIGTKGTIGVSRDDQLDTDPPALAARPVPPAELHLYVSDSHHSDFLGCVRTRQRPIADVEIGHRSATICHLNNIARAIGRPIRWDPLQEAIVGDDLAARQLDRPRRAPYGLL